MLAVTAAITAVQSTGVPFNVLITAELTATIAVRTPEIVVFQLDTITSNLGLFPTPIDAL